MGCNYYWIEDEKEQAERHIGKSSFAGTYCYECGVYLLKSGTTHAHKGDEEWWVKCPECNREVNSYASSFTWKKFNAYTTILLHLSNPKKIIEDENGDTYTGQEFIDKVLKDCPIPLWRQLYAEFC